MRIYRLIWLTSLAVASLWFPAQLWATDSDGDGLCDPLTTSTFYAHCFGEDNCRSIPNPNQYNHDGDNLGDACDSDDDNDGVPDAQDNCVIRSNPDQSDNDKDGKGDLCDSDDDNDGIYDTKDNCPLIANPDQLDTDNDGKGAACDAEAPKVVTPPPLDTDGDGIADTDDPDDDDDGIFDTSDNSPLVANPDQANSDQGYFVGKTVGGQFSPMYAIEAVAVDPTTGEYLITETGQQGFGCLNRIHRYSAEGKYIGMFETGGCGSNSGPFYGPTGIAVDSKGNVHTAQAGGHRVVTTDGNGKYLRSLCGGQVITDVANAGKTCPYSKAIGAFGLANGMSDGGFGNGVRYLAVGVQNGQELVFVADWANDRIQAFDPATGAFQFGYCDKCVGGTCAPMKFTAANVAACSSDSTMVRHLSMPIGIAVDADGLVYVTSSCEKTIVACTGTPKPRVVVLNADGSLHHSFYFTPQNAALQAYPIAVDAYHAIYVAEPKATAGQHFVTKFDNMGKVLATFAEAKTGGTDGLFEPFAGGTHKVGTRGLAVALAGNRLAIPDPGNARVEFSTIDHLGDLTDPCPATSDPQEPFACDPQYSLAAWLVTAGATPMLACKKGAPAGEDSSCIEVTLKWGNEVEPADEQNLVVWRNKTIATCLLKDEGFNPKTGEEKGGCAPLLDPNGVWGFPILPLSGSDLDPNNDFLLRVDGLGEFTLVK
ncbi:MAG: thrombospondin type 3 repeat-containing protein [Deltaproteobacteria bacterium]|nr:thrombospondin type 3 repeat-containing protein [Deltaproteobacteria bacterium]